VKWHTKIKKNATEEDISKDNDAVIINCKEDVQQSFAARYLTSFAKASNLSSIVRISMSPNVPLVVEYRFQDVGYLKYYLAPKIEEWHINKYYYVVDLIFLTVFW